MRTKASTGRFLLVVEFQHGVSTRNSTRHVQDGSVIVIDDNDSFIDDASTLNMLKTALNSGEKRVLTWTKQNAKVSDDVCEDDNDTDMIPSSLSSREPASFAATWISRASAQQDTAKGRHVSALIDRSWAVNLTVETKRDKAVWCDNVFRKSIAVMNNLPEYVVNDISSWVNENRDRFFSISLRLFEDIVSLAKEEIGEHGEYYADQVEWKQIVLATKCLNS